MKGVTEKERKSSIKLSTLSCQCGRSCVIKRLQVICWPGRLLILSMWKRILLPEEMRCCTPPLLVFSLPLRNQHLQKIPLPSALKNRNVLISVLLKNCAEQAAWAAEGQFGLHLTLSEGAKSPCRWVKSVGREQCSVCLRVDAPWKQCIA